MKSGLLSDKAIDSIDTFDPVFSILKSLTFDHDALIFSVNERFGRTELTHGRFNGLASLPLSAAFHTLTLPLTLKVGACLVVEIDDEAREKLFLPDFPNGALALVCLEKSGTTIDDSLVCAAIFEAKRNGSLKPESISAFKATARLNQRALGNSAQNQYSREVTQMRNFYRRFSQAIDQCFWVLDVNALTVVTVSENFEDVWGAHRSILSENGLAGFMSNVVPEDRDRVLAEFYTQVHTNFDFEFRVLNLQGNTRWMRLRMNRFGDESSLTPTADTGLALLIADDVTERRERLERERLQEASLVNRARALAVVDLASGVAHEINNPLTIIVGRASELKRRVLQGDIEPHAQVEFIDKIQSTALRIADIVKSLKSLTKQDRGAGFQLLDFATVAREVKDLSSERFKSQSVNLKIEVPRTELKAEMNPTLISQVILNLVYNALDAVDVPNGPFERWVTVDFSDDTDSVYIGVTDSGSGIPIKIRSRIFDPFFTTKDPGKGTGLGLSLSMSIAAHHDGALRLDTLHSHTRFVLQIPKRQSLHSKAQAAFKKTS